MKTLALILFMAASTLSFAQVRSFSLEEAQEYALIHSLEAKNANLELSIAESQIKQTTAIGLPQVSAGLNFQNFIDIPTSLVPAEFFGGQPGEFAEVQFGTEYNTTAELSANQLIFDGAYIVGLRAARVYRDVARQSKEKSAQAIKTNVANTYYTILVAEENQRILTKTKANLEEALFEITRLYEEGFLEETEKDQMELSLGQVESNLNRINRQIKITYDMLKFQMGIELGEKIKLADNLELVMKRVNPGALLSRDFEIDSNIDYSLAKTQTELQRLNWKKEQMGYLPKLGLFFNHQQSAQRNQFNFFDADETWYPTTIWGVNLSVPILSSGLRYQTTQQARIQYEMAMINQERTQNNLMLQEANARANFLAAADQYKMEEKNMKLALRIFDTSLIKYQEGLISGIDLNQIHNQLLSSQASYIQSILDYLEAKNNFETTLESFE